MQVVIDGIVKSTVRTITPWLVGLVVVALAKVNFNWTPTPAVFLFVSTGLSTVFYAGVRWLEERYSAKWGWLLGAIGAPSYGQPGSDTEEITEDDVTDAVAA